MLFSAYQIESLLAEFQQEFFPVDESASETLSLSEDAIQDAHQYFRPPKNPSLGWISPKDIMGLVEDQTPYDPVVDYVQQSRAGRFVVPAYIPENPAPPFSLVSDHTQVDQKSDAAEQETPESSTPEEDSQLHEVSTEKTEVEDQVSIIHSEEAAVEDTLSIEHEDDSLEMQTELDTEESEETPTDEPAISIAALFEGIDDEGLDEEDDIDVGGLHGEINDDNDVVFGDGHIDLKSMSIFVSKYPDSTIKFLLRKNLDGRSLPAGYEEIYTQWENRGLTRGRLKKYLFKLMEWIDFPDISANDVVTKIREYHFELKGKY